MPISGTSRGWHIMGLKVMTGIMTITNFYLLFHDVVFMAHGYKSTKIKHQDVIQKTLFHKLP